MTCTITSSAVPNPGTVDAQMRGCTCPVIDNHHGRGVPMPGGTVFYYSGDCPIHGWPKARDMK